MNTHQPPVTPARRLAWRVETNGWTGIVFAATHAKAKWVAVSSYWEAFGRSRGEWPAVKAWREPGLDKSWCRNLFPRVYHHEEC